MGKLHEALKKAGATRDREGPPRPAAEGVEPAAADASASQKVAANFAGSVYRGEADQNLVPLSNPHCAAAGQYRALRDGLLAAAAPGGLKVFAVTSALPGEGKSVSAANLACVLAEDPSRKVVLIDGDLRKPSLHSLIGVDNHRGLSDYLAGGTMLEMALQRSRLPNLWVLPGGHVPQDASELLAGKRLEDLLARLRRDYDFIVIDVPAVRSAADATIVAPRADGTLVVVRMGATPRETARAAVERLREANAQILGTILTAVPGGDEADHGIGGAPAPATPPHASAGV